MKNIIAGVLIGLISVVHAETVEMRYDNTHPLHAPEVVEGTAYEYDANGNLTYDGERRVTWNQDNLPTKITKGNTEVKFYYDASGQRVAKEVKDTTTGATTSKTIYVNQYYQPFTDAQGKLSTTKYYFTNGRVAVRNTPSGGESTLTYLHQDHLGSTVLATNSQSQKITDPLSYFPYGSSTNNQQLAMSNYLFTGQELDPESDFYNYNARLYNPTTGSFISPDPVQGPNRYVYVKGNPIRFTDPTGLWIPEEEVRDWPLPLDSIIEPTSTPGDLSVESALQFALFMEGKFSEVGVTSTLWEPSISEATELFGAGVVGAITGSLNQFDFLQCVGFARACARAMGGDIPTLGWEGLTEVGKELPGLEWHGSEDIMEENFGVAPGDVLFYLRQKTSHLAVITEVEGLTATLIEVVGTEFNRVGIYAPAGGIMINERTIDLSTGEVTGMYPGEIVGWGVYRVNP